MIHLDEKRNRISSIDLGNGKVENTDSIGLSDINYEMDEGGFEPIDPTIVESNDSDNFDYGLEIKKAKLKIKFSNSDIKPSIRKAKGKKDFGVNFNGLAIYSPSTENYNLISPLKPNPEIAYNEGGNSVVYLDVHSNINLKYIHQKTYIKQEVIIPEAERVNLSGNPEDYLVIVSELTADEISLIDNITLADDHEIYPEVAYFNERLFPDNRNIPMTTFHKKVGNKTFMLIGIPLNIANDIEANPGILVLDPTDTLSSTDVVSRWLLGRAATSFVTARNLTSSSGITTQFAVGVQNFNSGLTYDNFRQAVIIDMSAYDSADILSAAEVQIQLNSDGMTDHEFNLSWNKANLGSTIDSSDYKNFTGWTASSTYSVTAYTSGLNTTSMDFSGTYHADNKLAVNSSGLTDIQTAMDASGDFSMIGLSDKDIGNTLTGGLNVTNYVTSAAVADNVRLEITYTTVTIPDQVTGLTSYVGDHEKVRLTWNTPGGSPSGYRVYSSSDSYVSKLGNDLPLDTDIHIYTSGATGNDRDDSALTAFAVITPTISASDGISKNSVVLTISGTGITNGASISWKVAAFNGAGEGTKSAASTARFLTDTLDSSGYLYQRSAADSDASYSNLNGGVETTTPFNDTTAPENGDGRYYKGRASSSTGAISSLSVADRGYRAIVGVGDIITRTRGTVIDFGRGLKLTASRARGKIISAVRRKR